MDGIGGVENAYINAIKSNKLKFAGPTCFAPILRLSIKRCMKAFESNGKDGSSSNSENSSNRGSVNYRYFEQKYFILVILTDGWIHDLNETKKLIIEAANKPLPLSIIIVGIGNDPNLSCMNQLISTKKKPLIHNGRKAKRNIVQFVPFSKLSNDINYNYNQLAHTTLRKIPSQFLQFANYIKLTPPISTFKSILNHINENYNNSMNDCNTNDDSKEIAFDDNNSYNKISNISNNGKKSKQHKRNFGIDDTVSHTRSISNTDFDTYVPYFPEYSRNQSNTSTASGNNSGLSQTALRKHNKRMHSQANLHVKQKSGDYQSPYFNGNASNRRASASSAQSAIVTSNLEKARGTRGMQMQREMKENQEMRIKDKRSKHKYSQSQSQLIMKHQQSTFATWQAISLPHGWQRCVDQNGAMSFKDPSGKIHWKPPNVSLRN